MSKKHPPQQLQKHIPVLAEDVIASLQPRQGESYLDLTAGYGGHTSLVLALTKGQATLVDRDQNAIDYIKSLGLVNTRLIHLDFFAASKLLVSENKTFDMILVDLGVSSPQLDMAERGFSFRLDGPLDMRMDSRQTKTAADIVNNESEEALVQIITKFGEEKPHTARAIARSILGGRPFNNTRELAEAIRRVKRSKGKIHPATRTFQALRIATNDELGQIQSTLSLLPKLLNPGGRVAVISFHSLEDRLVKQYLRSQKDMGLEAELEPLTKRPIKGSDEDVHNPRARSARLRVAVKTKN